MKNQLSLFLALLTILSLFLSLNSCDNLPEVLEEISLEIGNERIAAVDSAVRVEMRHQNIPGMAVAVIQDGKVTHINGYGFTDEDRQDEVTIETVFRWASISKMYTAAMAMRLYEGGHLGLTDNVRNYVSTWPQTSGNPTIEQLLSNRGGIVSYSNCPNWSTRRNNYLSNNPHTYHPV
ncbi:MAG: serine hydrolase domain-containing protein, partial [Bacteroidota bacterium]